MLVLAACTQAPAPVQNNTQEPVPLLLKVTYAGGFVPTDMLQTVLTVTEGGNATLRTLGQNSTVTSEKTMILSTDEMDQLRRIVVNIGTLNKEYKQEPMLVADAGYADIVVKNMTTRIDPNVPEWYPGQLQPLRAWIDQVLSTFYEQPGQANLIECPPGIEKGGICTKEYNPVCANGQTYGNKCEACSAQSVNQYEEGACEGTGDINPDNGRVAFTQCTDPRPEICTREYNPVCGEVDNGVRCITTPCDSSDKVTFGNACEACANASTYGYWPGECGNMPSDTPKQCAASEDSYMSQLGPVCIKHYGDAEIKKWKTCNTQAQCTAGDSCVYATRTTDNKEVAWSGAPNEQGPYKESLRCVPEEYKNYLLHTSGVSGVDENGQSYSMIA
jgi:hypothetical protein